MELDLRALDNSDNDQNPQKSKRGNSILGLLSIFTLVIIATAASASYFYTSKLFENYVENFIYSEMERQLRHLQVNLNKKQLDRGGKWQDEFFLDYNNPTGKKYWQLSLRDEIILKSPSLGDGQLEIPEEQLSSSRIEYSGTGPGGIETLLVRGFVSGEQLGLDGPAQLMLAVSHQEVTEAVSRFRTELLLFLGGIVLLTVGGLFAALRSSTRPLYRLLRSIERVRLGETRRVPAGQPAELEPLASELNHLIEQQELAQDRSRARAASLAHNLKTPLATIMAELGRSDQTAALQAERIAAEVKRIENAVQRELSRTRIRSTAHGVSRRTVIAPLINNLVALQQRLPTGKAIDWTIDLERDLTVAIDTEDFAEIAGNLLDNARKWGKQAVMVSARVDGDMVVISVEDDGVGPPEGLESLSIESGLRLDERVAGSGVGLAIVYDVLVECGGEIEIGHSALGGFAAHVSIPAAS